jgi:hypothetical protein
VLGQCAVSSLLLHEPNHGLRAVRVEGGVVSSLCSLELIRAIFERVLTEVGLDVVPEIGDKPYSVTELNSHGLIVDSGPSA